MEIQIDQITPLVIFLEKTLIYLYKFPLRLLRKKQQLHSHLSAHQQKD